MSYLLSFMCLNIIKSFSKPLESFINFFYIISFIPCNNLYGETNAIVIPVHCGQYSLFVMHFV